MLRLSQQVESPVFPQVSTFFPTHSVKEKPVNVKSTGQKGCCIMCNSHKVLRVLNQPPMLQITSGADYKIYSEKSERFDDVLNHLLSIRKKHHGVVLEEQLIFDAGIARPQRAFDEQHGPCVLNVEDRHTKDR